MTMKRIGSIAIPLLLLGMATASAQTTTTTTTIETRRDPITLTPQQRTVIYKTVKRPAVVTTVPADVAIRRGAVVPPAVVLSPLPQTVYTDVPQLPQYRYFYVNNQLVLVDPVTSQVVDIIDE